MFVNAEEFILYKIKEKHNFAHTHTHTQLSDVEGNMSVSGGLIEEEITYQGADNVQANFATFPAIHWMQRKPVGTWKSRA